MTDDKPQKKRAPRGKPFIQGEDERRWLKGGHVAKNLATADELFLDEFFKEVDAKKGNAWVREKQYKLFMEQLIQHGIKGRMSDRKLVLQFFEQVEMRKAQRAAEAKTRLAGGAGTFNWDEAKERLLQGMKETVAEEAQREAR